MKTANKSNWGGKREGSGRKAETLSGRQVQAMLSKAKEWAKKEGKDIDDILLNLIYNAKNDKDQLAAIKLWKEYTIAKLQEGGETDTQLGPSIFLAEKHPDLKVVNGGKD